MSNFKEILNSNPQGRESWKKLLADLVSRRNVLPCTLFLNLSRWCEIDTRLIGQQLEEAGIKVDICAFGCFPKNKEVPPEPNHQVQELLDWIKRIYGDSVSCTQLWKIGFLYKGNFFKAVKYLNSQNIKITDCRLGLF